QIGKVRRVADVIVNDVGANEQSLVVGKVQVDFGNVRIQVCRSRCVEYETGGVQPIARIRVGTVRCTVRQSYQRGWIHTASVGEDCCDVRRSERNQRTGLARIRAWEAGRNFDITLR